MTDLSTLLWCLTVIIISCQASHFAKWYFKNETYLCDRLESALNQNEFLTNEVNRLKKELDAAKSPFSDINEQGGDIL